MMLELGLTRTINAHGQGIGDILPLAIGVAISGLSA
jgi:hypothetical protein